VRALTLRRYSPRTVESYVSRMYDLARYYMRPPSELNSDELQAYLYHLAYERKLSASTCNVAINALRSYYQLVEGVPRDQFTLMLPRPRSGWQLPEVLSVEEVERLIASAPQPHHRTFLMLVYGTGMRLAEAIHLRGKHIDSDRMQIRVESGKGNKDRIVPLGERAKAWLEKYRDEVRALQAPRLHGLAVSLEERLRPGLHRHGAIRLQAGGQTCGHHQGGRDPHPAPQLRHPYGRGRRQPGGGPALARPCRPAHHRALPPPEQARAGRLEEPAGSDRALDSAGDGGGTGLSTRCHSWRRSCAASEWII